MNNFPTIFVLTGPSGVGKSTLLDQVMPCIGSDIEFAVSSTTRLPRDGEEDGVDYNFLTPERFQGLLEAEGFLEWAEVFGNRYGTSWEAIDGPLNASRSVVLDLDLQGHRKVRSIRTINAVHIFIAPPGNSLEVLEDRLRARRETPENIARRMAEAQEIMDAAYEYDHIVVNDDEQTAVFSLLGIFLAHMNGLM